jgi:phospholipid/cholesterol/gamma-HCH transport system substrate-binding protein
MSDKLKNILIGLFALISITIIVGTILFIQPSIGDGKKTLNVKFSNISGINIGTRVTFAGKPIGEVVEIKEVKNARKDKKDEFGRIYYYQLKLKVDSSVEVYDSDTIAIQTTGLMGEKSIGITPKTSINKHHHIITNNIIYAKSVDSFENTADQISQLSDKAEKAIDNFNSWFERNSKNLSTTISAISKLLNDVDNQNIVGSLNNVLENLDIFSKNINEAHGSIGRFLNSDDLYLKCNAILSKANTLFNDINNYGLLFQYSKGWQRLRTKKANFLENLNNPQDFKNYFEKEIAEITTSLSRINQLIARAQNKSQKQKILTSDIYKRNFAYLLRQVESLLNMVKLYNEDLLDKTNAE